MIGRVAGFNWDDANTAKCQKHGLTVGEIEALFHDGLSIRPDLNHSQGETRFLGIGRTGQGRPIFVAFTIRRRDGKDYIRPISARYMHTKEINRYEQDNP
jgi:uncharacterized DUF497 family protein